MPLSKQINISIEKSPEQNKYEPLLSTLNAASASKETDAVYLVGLVKALSMMSFRNIRYWIQISIVPSWTVIEAAIDVKRAELSNRKAVVSRQENASRYSSDPAEIGKVRLTYPPTPVVLIWPLHFWILSLLPILTTFSSWEEPERSLKQKHLDVFNTKKNINF